MRISSLGHVVFALTMIGLGILGLVKGDFAVIWLPFPTGVPGREVFVYLCAFVSLACGIGLLLERAAAVVSRVLLLYLLAWLLLLRVPNILFSPTIDIIWAFSKIAVMAAAAWVLHVRLGGGKGLPIARALYGLALFPFGIAHFIYLKQTVVLIPAWLPWPTAWAYATGGAFIAAGIAVLVGVWARLAVVLSTWQVAGFTLVVWVPIVLAGSFSAFQWNEFVVSWALTAGGWVVAESYRGVPWLAPRGLPAASSTSR
jgi:uncharacterized membrane protein